MRNCIKSTLWIVSGLLITFVVGCGDDSAPPAPLSQYEPEIVNNPDNFSFQATAVENVTGTYSYTWSNSGTQATIDHSTVITGGSATVVIYDADNSSVYTNGLVASANESSAVGVAGNWRIVVSLANCSGTLNFNAQKL